MKGTFLDKIDRIFSQSESRFIAYFVAIFLGTAGLLAGFGLLPSELLEQSDGNTLTQSIAGAILGSGNDVQATDPLAASGNQGQYAAILQPRPTTGTQTGTASSGQTIVAGYPSRLVIPSIGVNTQVELPKSTDVDTLDRELMKGPVYYPGSGTPAGGNMFIFGHSTGYKVVINKAYKVFNDIHTLSKGDEIQVVSNGHTFIYKVKSVDKVNENETLVKFDTTSHLLTLSTCNSFGAKSDRYVVVAEYSGVKS